jgi:hypothetical protein
VHDDLKAATLLAGGASTQSSFKAVVMEDLDMLKPTSPAFDNQLAQALPLVYLTVFGNHCGRFGPQVESSLLAQFLADAKAYVTERGRKYSQHTYSIPALSVYSLISLARSRSLLLFQPVNTHTSRPSVHELTYCLLLRRDKVWSAVCAAFHQEGVPPASVFDLGDALHSARAELNAANFAELAGASQTNLYQAVALLSAQQSALLAKVSSLEETIHRSLAAGHSVPGGHSSPARASTPQTASLVSLPLPTVQRLMPCAPARATTANHKRAAAPARGPKYTVPEGFGGQSSATIASKLLEHGVLKDTDLVDRLDFSHAYTAVSTRKLKSKIKRFQQEMWRCDGAQVKIEQLEMKRPGARSVRWKEWVLSAHALGQVLGKDIIATARARDLEKKLGDRAMRNLKTNKPKAHKNRPKPLKDSLFSVCNALVSPSTAATSSRVPPSSAALATTITMSNSGTSSGAGPLASYFTAPARSSTAVDCKSVKSPEPSAVGTAPPVTPPSARRRSPRTPRTTSKVKRQKRC